MPARSSARLVTFAVSHYCEKARWALTACRVPFVEESHIPILLYWWTMRLGGRSVPLLVTDAGRVMSDSTDILRWLADEHDAPWLYPTAEAREWEELFDLELGPHARRVAYASLLPNARVARQLFRDHTGRAEGALAQLAFPLIRAAIVRGLRVTPEGARRSMDRVRGVFDRVEQHLAAGPSKYLVGSSFSAADLTLAALSSLVVRLPQGAPGVCPPPLDGFSEEGQRFVEECTARPAGQFVRRMYTDHRA